MPHFVLYDLEFTTWAGALEQDWSGPGHFREIVQIGALRVNPYDFRVVEQYNVLLRPIMNPELSDYFVELSGIDQEQVDRDGKPPADALGEFFAFIGSDPALSYGNDMVVIGENIAWARLRNEVVTPGYLYARLINIRPWLNTVAPQTAYANCGGLWEALHLPKPAAGKEHSALFDCFSLHTAIRHLSTTVGLPLPVGAAPSLPNGAQTQ